MSKIETGTDTDRINEELIPVSRYIDFEASQIPQIQKIGSCDKYFPLNEKSFRGEQVIFIAPEYPTYDQRELDRIAGIIDETISVESARKNFYIPDHREKNLFLPWRRYDEKVLPRQSFPGYAATEKGKKVIFGIYRTTIRLVPDRELGELLLLIEDGGTQDVQRILMEADAANAGESNVSDYPKRALDAQYGFDQLSVCLPSRLVEFLNSANCYLPEETLPTIRKNAYFNAAIALGK